MTDNCIIPLVDGGSKAVCLLFSLCYMVGRVVGLWDYSSQMGDILRMSFFVIIFFKFSNNNCQQA